MGGGGAVHCFPSHSVHRYKGNILQFDNYWGPGLASICFREADIVPENVFPGPTAFLGSHKGAKSKRRNFGPSVVS